MEVRTARTTPDHFRHPADSDDRIVEQRVDELLRLNAEIAREKKLYFSDRERIQASLMTFPIDSKRVYSYFGLMIGTLPPFALVLRSVTDHTPTAPGIVIFLILLAAAGIVTGIAGYASGRFVPAAVDRVAGFRQPNRIALVSLIGFAWGAISGAIGGVFLFIFGAVFAGVIGGLVGALTLPILVALHSILRTGDQIETKHFLPVAFGITLSLCALILGL